MDIDVNLDALHAQFANQKPDSFALAQLQANTGLSEKTPQPAFVDTKISTSIYDSHPNQELERATQKIFPTPIYKALVFKALGAGVTPMTYVRQLVAYGLSIAQFDLDAIFQDEKGVRVIPPEAKRKKDEDAKDSTTKTHRILKEYMREPTFSQLNYLARGLGISTLAALVACVDVLVDTENTMALITDSEEAMAEYAKAKKKKTLITEFMQTV